MFSANKKFSLPELEEKILKFWRANHVFEKSLKENRLGAQKSKTKNQRFIFYEGPPTANGAPGIHHVLSRAFKDLVPRYKTMRGYVVPRKGGWDTHGLPVELEVEKTLGLKSKKEIERYGIAKFNAACKESVWKYKSEWERLTERIGYWLDLKNPYITYENAYIEKLWEIIKKIHKRRLLYKGHKVLPWCPRCGTALSSHELAQGYKTVEDTSVYVKFKLREGQLVGNWKTEKNSYILSWTTTPWTLPGNVALAVNPGIDYAVVLFSIPQQEQTRESKSYVAGQRKIEKKEYFILAKSRLSIFNIPPTVLQTFKGADLIGLRHEPLFDIATFKKSKTAFRVYPADFVATDEGTGVVHTAVMYGEDDYKLGEEIGLPQHHTVNEMGKFTRDVPGLAGLFVKSGETEKKIIEYLVKNNALFKTEPYRHEYPHCWRCGTPVIYYARDSWFIAMSKLKKELITENKKVNWIPEHIKEGRFGEWLRGVKDWAVSRERYWGTPLPIWECTGCGAQEVIGNYDELRNRMNQKPRNRYLVMRHGRAKSNRQNRTSSVPGTSRDALTLAGRKEVEKQARALKKENIDFVIASPFGRTRETARIIAETLGVKSVKIDKRLREINVGTFERRQADEYHAYFASYADKFTKRPPKGESLRDVAARVFSFITETERKYKNKTILLITHEYVSWMLYAVLRGLDETEAIAEKERRGPDFLRTAEIEEIPFVPFPRNEQGFGDPHRPFIDAVVFPCLKCKEKMRRVKEIIDVWFDSGAMPWAQNPTSHSINSKFITDFPADYIAEAVDQTRGWFYTLLAISVALGKGTPYKNVISLGHILDKNGQKMSKSKGNVVNPWEMIQKYGADVIRWHFFTMNQPGEPKNFDEQDLARVSRRFFLLLYNSYIFFHTYADKKILNLKSRVLHPTHVLDKWILARLNETILTATKLLETYRITDAARAIEEFSGDLSRWYIRRSRRRFQKPKNQKDYRSASQTLGYALHELSKLLAPFTPFFAEWLFSEIKPLKSEASVHLTDWPLPDKKLIDKKLLRGMTEIRRVAALVLAKRADAGIKVRQPLQKLKIKNEKTKKQKELLEILKDEINVKEIVFDKNVKTEIELDTALTHKLKEEGWFRELARAIQGLRQDAGLQPKDAIALFLELPEELRFVIAKNENGLKKEVGAETISYNKSRKYKAELETRIDNWNVWLGLRRIRRGY